ncbi:MAG: AAA family ATPase [Prevotellaceae bacterium]|jgi:AAA15 family ATPase/GTPase|nr:AAA family ATPase [Prevotellaceae bacterium]
MENFIKYVDIHNFKSIKDLRLEDCRRINLFIGYPNVGKSNVLEALGLFSVPFLEKGENLNKLVRVENAVELFNSSSNNNFCNISTNLKELEIELGLSPSCLDISHGKDENGMLYSFLEDLKLLDKGSPYSNSKDKELIFFDKSSIKRYTFNSNNEWKSDNKNQLLPPFGENIVDVLSFNQNMSDVLNFIKQEFEKSGLQLVLNKKDKSILVQRKVSKEIVLLLPYFSIADTLQRCIFYKTAIASNKNSVLLFEEPEAHAFPPYIQTIMNDIIDAESNQFFIVTHSPLVVNAFLEYEKTRKETSIYLFDFKDNQTTAKRLSDEEMQLAYDYGDLFFNLENFL